VIDRPYSRHRADAVVKLFLKKKMKTGLLVASRAGLPFPLGYDSSKLCVYLRTPYRGGYIPYHSAGN